MKKTFFSMKHKFVIMVASLLLAFVLVTTVIWGVAFTSEITERGVEYAGQMTETANRNVESYLKKLRLIAFVLQNNYLAKPILNKTFYEDDSERLTDMRNMQLLLKAVMTQGSFDKLLQTGEYTVREKWTNRRVGWFAGAYWCLVTAVYLAVSFWNDNWEKSWIIWAVAGLVFAALYSAVRAWADRKNQ